MENNEKLLHADEDTLDSVSGGGKGGDIYYRVCCTCGQNIPLEASTRYLTNNNICPRCGGRLTSWVR